MAGALPLEFSHRTVHPHIYQIMQRRQEMAAFTMAHSCWKTRKSLPKETSTCWPYCHSKKLEAPLPSGLWQESSQSSASELSPVLCVLSKSFHTESPIPITPQDSIKMIGKNRPGFLAGQPEHTAPRGEAGWLGSLVVVTSPRRAAEGSRSSVIRRCYQESTGEMHGSAHCDMGFPGKVEDRPILPWHLGWSKREM